MQLANLLDMNSPKAILDETTAILALMYPAPDSKPVAVAFKVTDDLYHGRYPGVKACNTSYHDFGHATRTFLAMARLMHGAHVDGLRVAMQQACLGLVAALFHDVGFIQEEGDREGTGAKHSRNHELRSINLVARCGPRLGLNADDLTEVGSLILCTDFAVDIKSLQFNSKTAASLGQMLGTADLVAQMSERAYLEKLLFLYHELKEGQIGEFKDEVDLLQKSVDFYKFAAHRLDHDLGAVYRYLQLHFKARWQIDEDLYRIAIDNQKQYLHRIVNDKHSDPRTRLKRGAIVNKIREQYGPQES